MINKTAVARSNNGSSLRMTLPSRAMGVMSAEIPNTRPILARFEPVMLPKARAVSSRRAPITFMTNSGALDPKATTVKPTTSGEIP